MRSIYSFISLFVISFLTILASATSTTGNRVLILLDSLTDVDKYTQFWDQLQSNVFVQRQLFHLFALSRARL